MKSGSLINVFGLVVSFSSLSGQPLNNKGLCNKDAFERAPLAYAYSRGEGYMFPQDYQLPLTAEESIKCIETPEGFVAELWASEEMDAQIRFAQAFTFDARGRAWIIETPDYPNTKTAQFAGNDEIIILEDTDGDNVADTRKVFVGGLNLPQGLAFIPEGLIVLAPPYLLLYTDDDGDDVADDPEGTVILEGFSKGDTHAGASSLRFGMDNWIYGSHGYAGSNLTGNFNGSIAMSHSPWRVRRDGSDLQKLNVDFCGNQWGNGFSEGNQLFWSCATSNRPVNINIVPGINRRDARVGGDPMSSSWNPGGTAPHSLTLDVNDGDSTFSDPPNRVHKWTSTTGAEVYSSKQFPADYRNSSVFVCDGVHHLCGTFFLERDGSTFMAHDEAPRWSIFASWDAQVAPIMAKVGPDGALWVLDWYNYVYLHSGAGPAGAGAAVTAVPDVRKDVHARFYRVVYEGNPLMPTHDLFNASVEKLVNTLGDPTMMWRLEAQKQIIKRGLNAEIETALTDILTSRTGSDPETGIDYKTLHALWAMHGLGVYEANPDKWNPILKNLLLHPSFAVRKNTVMAMPQTEASAEAIRDQNTLCDTDPHVRVQAVWALGFMPEVSGLEITNAYGDLDFEMEQVYSESDLQQDYTRTATCTPPRLRPVKTREPYRSDKKIRFFMVADKSGGLRLKNAPDSYRGTLELFSTTGKQIKTHSLDSENPNSGLMLTEPGIVAYVLKLDAGQTRGVLFYK